MQAIEHDELRRNILPYSPKGMKKLLEDDKVKEVRVFNLKKGMKVTIEGSLYKVITVRSNGKITLRRN